jgi:hypothetical protein
MYLSCSEVMIFSSFLWYWGHQVSIQAKLAAVVASSASAIACGLH